MRILGIDPGTARLGYSILDFDEKKCSLKLINCGIIQTRKIDEDSLRLKIIREDLLKIINEFKPEFASVEKLFFFKNPKTIIPVAQARGIILEACASSGIKILEFTPLEMKKIVTGNGGANKTIVSDVVHSMLDLNERIKPDDAVDAVAMAISASRSPIVAFREVS